MCIFGFSNLWVCVCVGLVMWQCYDNCEGALVICVPVFTVFLYCFLYVHLFLFVTGARTTATGRQLNCSK